MTDFQPGQVPQSCAFVIFGVTGDLTRRLIVPALYNLAAEELLPDKFCVVGVARHGISKDALCEVLLKGVREFATRRVEDKIVNRLFECVTPVEADSGDACSFDRLKSSLKGWKWRATPEAIDYFTWRPRPMRLRRLRASSAAWGS